MRNGTAALQLVTSEPPSTSPRPSGKPDAASTGTELEIKIGHAVADAAILLCAAVLGYHETGRVPSVLKEDGGTRIARVVELQMSTFGGIDFNAVAYREGKNRLRRFLSSGTNRQQGDAMLDRMIFEVLFVVEKVVALEKTLTAN